MTTTAVGGDAVEIVAVQTGFSNERQAPMATSSALMIGVQFLLCRRD
jgi:hypothetical protein